MNIKKQIEIQVSSEDLCKMIQEKVYDEYGEEIQVEPDMLKVQYTSDSPTYIRYISFKIEKDVESRSYYD
jgi:hypothetical protein